MNIALQDRLSIGKPIFSIPKIKKGGEEDLRIQVLQK